MFVMEMINICSGPIWKLFDHIMLKIAGAGNYSAIQCIMRFKLMENIYTSVTDMEC